MQATDREEFNRHMSILCAAFDVPVGDRPESYWRAFNRLSLVGFVRMVEAACGPDADFKRIPTVPQLWGLRKAARTAAAPAMPDGMQAALVEYVMRNCRISDRQRAMPWNWIARDSGELLGVIVPQCPVDPVKHPAHRVLFTEVDWRKHLEAA